jgi:hypothetical protein
MFKDKWGYSSIFVVFVAAGFWLGYAITGLVRDSSPFSTSVMWSSVAAAAVVVGMGVVYFSMRYRHGGQEIPSSIDIPCRIEDTEHIKVNNYHFIMATSKRERGIASIRSSDIVNGIAVEPVNRDAHPHRIKIEVRLNERSDEITVQELVINAGTMVPVTLLFPNRLRLAEISSIDIRIRQA